ncbi:hypothetical protein PAXINDRAFT_166907 [Paxillus involutus ATCC 200175]|nr:hypothetical protein PAXINDRAFT_166907 [Paxillus involutus ATCC 200175]
MVSPWFSNGSLSSYLSKHQTMDPSGRQGLLFDITSGLRYLHSQDVVHGDLHSGNVLIDDNGRACLTDFGLSLIIREFVGTSYLKSSVCGSVRYADPELVRQVHADAGVVYPTKSSDVYSFGGLTLYVCSVRKTAVRGHQRNPGHCVTFEGKAAKVTRRRRADFPRTQVAHPTVLELPGERASFSRGYRVIIAGGVGLKGSTRKRGVLGI